MRVCQFRHFGLGNAPDRYSAQMKGGNFSIVKVLVLLSIHSASRFGSRAASGAAGGGESIRTTTDLGVREVALMIRT